MDKRWESNAVDTVESIYPEEGRSPMYSCYRRIVAVATLLVAGSGCSVGHDRPADDPQSTAYVFEAMKRAADAVTSVRFAEDLSDYLPGQEISFDGRPPVPLAAGVVRGRITAAEVAAAGRTIFRGTEEIEERIDPDSPDADWRHVIASVEVEEGWGDAADNEVVRFIVPIGGFENPQVYIEGLTRLDDVLVVLDRSDDSDPDGYRLAEEETALGVIDDGRIRFPAMDDHDAEQFTKTVGSLDELRDWAHRTQPLIRVEDWTVVAR